MFNKLCNKYKTCINKINWDKRIKFNDLHSSDNNSNDYIAENLEKIKKNYLMNIDNIHLEYNWKEIPREFDKKN